MFVLPWRLLASDCDAERRVKLSALLRSIEEVSIADTTRLHMGREKTLDKGLLWVIGRLSLKINELPHYDDAVRLITYPEKREHVLFPRYYVLKSPLGKTYLEAEALWTLIDIHTRKPVNPKDYGILIRAFPFKKENEILPIVQPLPIEKTLTRKVLYSELDLNGHMTNTRYADWFVDLFAEELKAKNLASFNLAFKEEAKEGEVLSLGFGEKDDKAYLVGSSNGHDVFQISASFR
jgi:medium-chain acyl-[acyl-carrier-protein] hydrolase